MKEIEIKKIPEHFSNQDLKDLITIIDEHLTPNELAELNWPTNYPKSPKVEFRIGYNDHYLFVKYHVVEDQYRVVANTNGGNVWEDSCVEFFIQPYENEGYYNIEINAGGAIYMAYGPDRFNREQAPREIIDRITKVGNLHFFQDKNNKIQYHWNIIERIPYSVFFKHEFKPAEGTIAKANFYKCGDKMNEANFLSWNPIDTQAADFHRPEFFGKIIFK